MCVCVESNSCKTAISFPWMSSIKSPPPLPAVCGSVSACARRLTNALHCWEDKRTLGLKGAFVCLLVRVQKCTQTGGARSYQRARVCSYKMTNIFCSSTTSEQFPSTAAATSLLQKCLKTPKVGSNRNLPLN